MVTIVGGEVMERQEKQEWIRYVRLCNVMSAGSVDSIQRRTFAEIG